MWQWFLRLIGLLPPLPEQSKVKEVDLWQVAESTIATLESEVDSLKQQLLSIVRAIADRSARVSEAEKHLKQMECLERDNQNKSEQVLQAIAQRVTDARGEVLGLQTEQTRDDEVSRSLEVQIREIGQGILRSRSELRRLKAENLSAEIQTSRLRALLNNTEGSISQIQERVSDAKAEAAAWAELAKRS